MAFAWIVGISAFTGATIGALLDDADVGVGLFILFSLAGGSVLLALG